MLSYNALHIFIEVIEYTLSLSYLGDHCSERFFNSMLNSSCLCLNYFSLWAIHVFKLSHLGSFGFFLCILYDCQKKDSDWAHTTDHTKSGITCSALSVMWHPFSKIAWRFSSVHISELFFDPQRISRKACLRKQTKTNNRETATETYWKALKIK